MPDAIGSIEELWRYPVSGLQGESLASAKVYPGGIEGDHLYVIREARSGSVMDPKKHGYSWGETRQSDRMLYLSARLDGRPEHDHVVSITEAGGKTFASCEGEFQAELNRVVGLDVEFVRYPRLVESRIRSGRALHLLTRASIDKLSEFHRGDYDVRRFRPNILVDTKHAGGFVEEEWVGKALRAGAGVILKVEKPNVRCSVTTMDQAGVPRDPGMLEAIERWNGKRLGVMCSVIKGGTLQVGDAVSLAQHG